MEKRTEVQFDDLSDGGMADLSSEAKVYHSTTKLYTPNRAAAIYTNMHVQIHFLHASKYMI